MNTKTSDGTRGTGSRVIPKSIHHGLVYWFVFLVWVAEVNVDWSPGPRPVCPPSCSLREDPPLSILFSVVGRASTRYSSSLCRRKSRQNSIHNYRRLIPMPNIRARAPGPFRAPPTHNSSLQNNRSRQAGGRWSDGGAGSHRPLRRGGSALWTSCRVTVKGRPWTLPVKETYESL